MGRDTSPHGPADRERDGRSDVNDWRDRRARAHNGRTTGGGIAASLDRRPPAVTEPDVSIWPGSGHLYLGLTLAVSRLLRFPRSFESGPEVGLFRAAAAPPSSSYASAVPIFTITDPTVPPALQGPLLVDDNGRRRYWATVESYLSHAQLRPSTAAICLAAIDRLYAFAERPWEHDRLNAVRGAAPQPPCRWRHGWGLGVPPRLR